MDAMRTGNKDNGHINCNIPLRAASKMEWNLWAYERYWMFKYL